MINLDQVESLSKINNNGKDALVFNYKSGRSEIWLFNSSDSRERAFVALRNGEQTDFLVD
ncbi:hypothetical protein [Arundinibacter roseus]|uniref:Uncharacterized protein n=1 Tax=Arundinibacter roseus TaxID=2070510 RepID=A0A4R4KHQ9_9BACT|nr:hypothetical protein [Arundinibacter roseus]TDB67313.1 hypothetical protein EZE20_05020 [Arundinibacter roseus]